jgi:hypothetical protein
MNFVPHKLCNPSFTPLLPQQIAEETFEIIQSDVLQGSKVVLDVEEGGPGKRSITSLESATSITSDMSCFIASDGNERCYIDALPGECDVVNSFASDGRRHLNVMEDLKGTLPNVPTPAMTSLKDVPTLDRRHLFPSQVNDLIEKSKTENKTAKNKKPVGG